MIFDSAGKFINKITPKDVAASVDFPANSASASVFNSFTVSRENGVNYLAVFSNGSLLKYDLEGKLVSKVKDGRLNPEYLLSDSVKVVPDFSLDGTNYYEFAIFRGDRAEHYFPFSVERYMDDEYISVSSRFDMATDGGSILYTDYFSYDVLELSASGVRLKYRFILPQGNALPADFMQNPEYKAKRWEYLQNNKSVVYGIHNLVQMGDYLFFTLDAAAQHIAPKKSIAYHLKTGEALSIQHITPDETSFFLPVTDSSYGNNFLSAGFLSYDDRSFYTSISSLSMFRFHAENKEGNAYPAPLSSYFGENKPDSNPVLVKVTPRID